MSMAPTCSCGECTKCKRREYHREWQNRKRAQDLEAARARDRAAYARRKQDPEWVARRNEKSRGRRTPYDEKERARRNLQKAVRDGRVVRQPCEICGDPRSHGHHDDYTKPQDVRWLCAQHHADLHRGVLCA